MPEFDFKNSWDSGNQTLANFRGFPGKFISGSGGNETLVLDTEGSVLGFALKKIERHKFNFNIVV